MNISIGTNNNSIYKKNTLSEISICKGINSNNSKNSNVSINESPILELSKKGLSMSKANMSLEEKDVQNINNNGIIEILNYQKELLNTEKQYETSKAMMPVTEKYYSMIDSLKQKYGESDEFIKHKNYLDKAFDSEKELFAMRVAANITAPMITIDYNSRYEIENYNNRGKNSYNKIKSNDSEIFKVQSDIRQKITEDVLNMFNNISNYYDKNSSFKNITNEIISSNNNYIKYEDIDYMKNLNDKTGIHDKFNDILSHKYNNSSETYREIKNIVDNMNCSDILKSMYNEMLNNLNKKINIFDK